MSLAPDLKRKVGLFVSCSPTTRATQRDSVLKKRIKAASSGWPYNGRVTEPQKQLKSVLKLNKKTAANRLQMDSHYPPFTLILKVRLVFALP